MKIWHFSSNYFLKFWVLFSLLSFYRNDKSNESFIIITLKERFEVPLPKDCFKNHFQYKIIVINCKSWITHLAYYKWGELISDKRGPTLVPNGNRQIHTYTPGNRGSATGIFRLKHKLCAVRIRESVRESKRFWIAGYERANW